MIKILILGAGGQIARVATDLFLQRSDVKLALLLRKSRRLKVSNQSDRVSILEGDVMNTALLAKCMVGQDVVYANLSGDLEGQAHSIIKAMKQTGLSRLIFISSMGIYNEVPGEEYGSILDPYRKAALAIEATDLDYTIIRPGWLNNRDEISYGTTTKGQPFSNPSAQVSRKSVADLVVKLCTTPRLASRASLGVHHA